MTIEIIRRLGAALLSFFKSKSPSTVPAVVKAGPTPEQDRRFIKALSIAALAAGAITLPELAQAAPWDGVATAVLSLLTGGLTRTIAIVCVIAAGIAALAGKLSWDWVTKIVIGVTLIFGSAAIVDYFVAAA